MGDGPKTDQETEFGMSDTTVTAEAGEQNEQVQEQAQEFEAITSQEDFDARIQARIARERGKFADYDELKAAAGRLQELEDVGKTAEQKANEETEQLRRENAELKAGQLRSTVAAAKGVPAELLSGSTQAELEASADALIQFRGDQGGKKLHVPAEGKQPTVQVSDEKQFVQDLFGSGD